MNYVTHLLVAATTFMWVSELSADTFAASSGACYGQANPTIISESVCAQPKTCKYGNRSELTCRDGITVRALSPKMCMLGDQYPLEFVIEACEDVCDVVLNAQLPEGVTFLKSEPVAKQKGNVLTWDIGPLKKCDCITAKVWLKCDCEGELCACFCASATPVRFCSIVCAKPKLQCQKTGPSEASPGEKITYRVTVTNKGSCAAEEVTVTDNLPEGLQHASGMKSLCYKIGRLAPSECRTIDIPVCAVKRGTFCNTAIVTSCNAESTSCQVCTTISSKDIELKKSGPKEAILGKSAEYQLTVTNTGDLPLTNVVITDSAPQATEIVSASGATIRGHQAVWKLKELKAGDKASFSMTLATCTPGSFTNRATVSTNEGPQASSETTTRWKGMPDIHAKISDSEGPICMGDSTSINISVVNQGPEPDKNVRISVTFPSQVQPTSIAGDVKGTISGNTVTFEPRETLWPRQCVTIRIDAKGRESGNGQIKLEVLSDSSQQPVTQLETVRVY